MADERRDAELQGPVPPAWDEEPELYVEPHPLRTSDTVGVVVALLALAVIGISGYIWLNPDLTAATVLARVRTPQQTVEPAVFKADVDAAGERCPYCNMFAERSASHIAAQLADGMVHHFDAWDCLFKYAVAQKLALVSAQVVRHGSDLDEPEWLTATDAHYLYDTTEAVAGSMPPYTAAFVDDHSAMTAQNDMGGTLTDFKGLMGHWSFTDYQPDLIVIPKEPEAVAAAKAEAPASEQGVADALADPGGHTHDMSCPVCGMFADKSHSHIAVLWNDGSHSHFDAWDCVFAYEADSGRMLDQARVVNYAANGGPAWLDATLAFYLYDTKEIEGSTPPYVAAFVDRKAAEDARLELGGEVVDFAGLRERWRK
jgi:nitrous oxide reductase accessory protein NosL